MMINLVRDQSELVGVVNIGHLQTSTHLSENFLTQLCQNISQTEHYLFAHMVADVIGWLAFHPITDGPLEGDQGPL